MLVCEHAERDEVSPLGRDRRAPCKLNPPDVVVASGGCQRGDHLTGTNHEQIESGRSERHKPPSTGLRSRFPPPPLGKAFRGPSDVYVGGSLREVSVEIVVLEHVLQPGAALEVQDLHLPNAGEPSSVVRNEGRGVVEW